jgi:hypothetical protein
MTTAPKITHAFAILAPVPEEHLLSGLESIQVQEAKGIEEPIVAFGSTAFNIFRKADELREGHGGSLVEVFLYASHAEEQPLTPKATWHAVYVKHIEARNGRYPKERSYERPETALNGDKPVWAIFWQVQSLKKLNVPIPIKQFHGLDKRSPYQARFIPEGPLLVQYPQLPGSVS